jgi:putative spermidine/putrescine transport system ATP-binding protein
MTVAENIAFPLTMRKVPRSELEARVARQLDLTRMSHLSSRYPAELSGGQQQRVAFARATVFDPPVLLLDEPLGALDKRLRETIQLEIKSMHSRLGLTMIYVTHDQGEALAVSDRVAVMNLGRLEQIGTPEDLYEAPATRFVADFVGDANFLIGRISDQAGAGTCVTLPGGARFIAPSRVQSEAHGLAEVMIRPERLSILPTQAQLGDAKPNRITGRVTDRSYVGEASKITILSEEGLTITARTPNVGREPHIIRIGDTITLGWDPEDSLMFPVEDRE